MEKAGKKKTILLVEDDSDLAELVTLRLRDAGYEVISCRDGQHAIHTVKNSSPDLIVLDVFLPSVDGYSVLRAVKDYFIKEKGNTDLPVIVITGRGALMKDMFKLEGVREFLQKPFEVTQLVEMVREHIGS